MKWFKFYGQEYLIDPKILSLSASERSCWITLLSYASVNDNENDNGVITFLSEQRLMLMSGIDIENEEWAKTEGVLKKLEKLQMITLDNADDNTKITILNWRKRQETSLTPYERVKRYREKKKDDNADDNAMITTDKIREDKNRKEKKRIEKKKIELSSEQSSQIKQIMDIFYKINPTLNWGNKTTRKAAADMIKRFTFEETKRMAEVVVAIQGQKYAPVATTPYEMKEKLAKFQIYFAREKNKKRKIGKINE